MYRKHLIDRNYIKSIIIYFMLFLITTFGICFYANCLSKNSFGAYNEKLFLQANIEKYINYNISDHDKGTLLQYNVKAGREFQEDEDKYVPLKQSQIKLEMSKIDNKYPYDVKVITKSTESTNGKTEKITDDYRYDSETGTLIINASNLDENGKLINENKIKDAKDEYIIICYYDTYTEESAEREIEMNGVAVGVVSEDDRLISIKENFKGQVKENIGKLTSIEYNTEKVENGNIKSNIINGTDYNTEYKESQKIVVSKKEAQDIIELAEKNTLIKVENNENNEEITSNLGNNQQLVYKTTTFKKNEIEKLLSEDGKIEILDANGNIIETIDKNSEFKEDGTITIDYSDDVETIIFKISKIKNEGILEIYNVKEIKSTVREAINIKIQTESALIGLKESINNDNHEKIENKVFTNLYKNVVKIEDSKSNLEFEINNTNWTNKEQNEITFDVYINSNTVNYNMLKNPTVIIELPNEVEKVILKNSYVSYANGLVLQEPYIRTNDNGNKFIIANLIGEQKEYEDNKLGLVTDLRINATIILNKELEETTKNIKLTYINNYTLDRQKEVIYKNKKICIKNYKEEDTKVQSVLTNVQSRNITRAVNNTGKLKLEVIPIKGDVELNNGDVVYEGEFIKYNIKVTNISDTQIENLKLIANIPEQTLFAQLDADYNNYMGKYEYNFDESITEKEIEIGTLKSNETYEDFYEVKVKDLQANQNDIEIITNMSTYINEQEENNYNIKNIAKKAEAKVFLGASLDNSEDRWNYSLKVESEEDKQIDVKIQFPREFKVKLRVRAGGQQSSEELNYLQADENNVITDTIDTNKEYWYEGEIESDLISETTDNKPIILTAVATAQIDEIEYKSNENRINYEKRTISVTMTSKKEGEEINYGEEIDYEIVIKNTGKTNLIQEEKDVFSVNVQDYIPEELKLTSIEYENWEETENGWEKKTASENVKIKYYDENGNKLPDIDLTLTIPYGESIKVIIKATPQEIYKKTIIRNSATVTGRYINTKMSNIITNTVLPFLEEEENTDNNEKENNEEKNTTGQDNTNTEKQADDEKKYSISGIAWEDKNKDGQRQEDEEKIKDVEVMLANVNESKNIIAKTTTDSNGIYQFKNLDFGRYIVLFKYDINSYIITEYQKTGVSANINSDANFKNIDLNGEELDVGVTDIIELNQNIANIDIGLIKNGICDVSLEKYISKVTVTTNKTTKQYSYEKQKLAKVEIKAKEIEGATIEIEYKIVVTNEGEVPVYIGKVTDYIPEGLEFLIEKNNNWGKQTGNKLINTSLSNISLNAGESTELTLILTKSLSGNATGEYKNSAEISEISNIFNLGDKDSTPGNNKEGEDDYSEASVIISIGTGGIIYISIIVSTLLSFTIMLTILSKKGILKNKNITRIAKLSIFLVIFSGVLLTKDSTTWSAEKSTTTHVAPQSLYFAWDPDSEHRNDFGSICFESEKIDGKEWEAHCQNAGLYAASDTYSFFKATGLIDEKEVSTNNIPEVTIKKQDYNSEEKNYDVVNIEKKEWEGKEYWLYGPFSLDCEIKNKAENSIIQYSIEVITARETIKIDVDNNNNRNDYRIVADTYMNGYTFGNRIEEGRFKEKFYIRLPKEDIITSKLRQNYKRDGIHKVIITAKVNGITINKKPTSGYLHYYFNNFSQTIKTTERHECYEYTSQNSFKCSDSEEWNTFNVELNINKIDYDDPKIKLNDVDFIITRKEEEKEYALESIKKMFDMDRLSYNINDPKGYKEGDWIELNEDDIKNKTENYNNSIQKTTSNITWSGNIMIKNLKAIGIDQYKIREVCNNIYGYSGLPESTTIELYNRIPEEDNLGALSNCGRVIDINIENRKDTGNLLIKKKDEDTEKPLEGIKFRIKRKSNGEYLIAINEQNEKQSTVTKNILLGNLEYTTNKDEATEFITNSQGYIRIFNLLCDDYIIEEIESPEHLEYDVNDKDSIVWSTSCTGTDNQTTEKTGKGKEIEVTVKRQLSTETNKIIMKKVSNKVTITNKKRSIKIKGYAFEDNVSGKDDDKNNLYDEGSDDKRLQGIVVKLYKNNGELWETRITDENGEYVFGDHLNDKKINENGEIVPVDRINREDIEGSYIEFEYNGMNYETTDIVFEKDEQGNITNRILDNSSNVQENKTKSEVTRDIFNEKYKVIENNKAIGTENNQTNEESLEYRYNEQEHSSKLILGDNPLYGYEGQEYPSSGVYNKYIMTANTYDADDTEEHSRILGQNLTLDEIKNMKDDEIKNINLGLRKREMPDLAISTDINNVEININGYTHIFQGNNRIGTKENRKSYSEDGSDENAIFNATVKAGSKYKADSYTRELYESDCVYSGVNPFEAYVTYEIKIRNESTNLTSTVNRLVNYYDKNYLEPYSYKIDDNESTEEIDVSNIAYNDNYNKLEIKAINLKINHQKEKSVIIKYKLKTYEHIIYDTMLDEKTLDKKKIMLNNYTEITSYSSEKDNKVYGGIDKDSNPGNFNLKAETEKEQKNEDDNDKAPTFKIIVKGRQLQGTVFVDSLLDDKKGGQGNERQGNGIYDHGEETIEGVKVGLYKTTDFDENGKLLEDENGNLPKTSGKTYYTSKLSDDDKKMTIDGKEYYYNQNGVTADDGEYLVTDFIPGDYKLVYIWGNGKYSVEDYKGTIWTEENVKEKYQDGNRNKEEKKDWYRNQTNDENGNTIRFTDAKDNWQMREENERLMQSATNDLCFRIELGDDINSETVISKLIDNNLKFIIPNIDFGIVERAKQSLKIDKKVESINITLAKGQPVVEAKFDKDGKLVGTAKGVNYEPSENNNGQIWVSLDSNIIQGANADITYKISVKNNSEKDYSTKDYYYYGIADDRYLIKLKPEGVYDYLDNTMTFNPESNKIQGNGTWQIISQEQYSDEKVTKPTIIEEYLYKMYSSKIEDKSTIKNIIGYESFEKVYSEAIKSWSMSKIKVAREKRLADKTILYNAKLEKSIELGGENTAIIQVSKLLSNQDEIDLNNDSEIVTIKDENNGGRRIYPIIEELYDRAENIIISTNPGRTDYTIEIVQISLIGLVIIATGIIFVTIHGYKNSAKHK